MLEILQFYVSGFWVWLGITLGMAVVGIYATTAISAFVLALRK